MSETGLSHVWRLLLILFGGGSGAGADAPAAGAAALPAPAASAPAELEGGESGENAPSGEGEGDGDGATGSPPPESGVPDGMDTGDLEWFNLPPTPLAGCYQTLADEGVTYKESPMRVRWNKSKEFLCGAKQVVRYKKGPGAIRWSSSSPRMTCKMAAGLAKFERIVQEEIKKEFGERSRVTKIQHIGTFNCRGIAAYEGWVSQHSFANAIDIKTFTLQNGREISIKKHYGRGPDAPNHREGRFLRALVRRLVKEKVFSVVVTPNFDRAHHNHIHVDLAPYEVDGT